MRLLGRGARGERLVVALEEGYAYAEEHLAALGEEAVEDTQRGCVGERANKEAVEPRANQRGELRADLFQMHRCRPAPHRGELSERVSQRPCPCARRGSGERIEDLVVCAAWLEQLSSLQQGDQGRVHQRLVQLVHEHCAHVAQGRAVVASGCKSNRAEHPADDEQLCRVKAMFVSPSDCVQLPAERGHVRQSRGYRELHAHGVKAYGGTTKRLGENVGVRGNVLGLGCAAASEHIPDEAALLIAYARAHAPLEHELGVAFEHANTVQHVVHTGRRTRAAAWAGAARRTVRW
mmetsp:Transcript_6509/g.16679  ORF Transcript_6509/g.16679 Transcript_6509/m.16679 type:complete len:292 (-) Transcript_6509:154-1029(-)